MKIAKNLGIWATAFAVFLGSCDKFNQNIAPANQKETFVKYYGHVYSQAAADIETVAKDGGYVLFGSTTSFVAPTERGTYNNFFLVKTDTLGNEVWSRSFGKGNSGDTIYDNTAQKLIALPEDEGYILAGNCQRIELIGGQRIRKQKRILLIQLDKDGVEVDRSIQPFDFNVDSDKDWEIRDIKIIPNSQGQLAITGTTTKVNTNKPEYNPTTDLSDVFVARLLDINTIFWQFAYGFGGNDMGVFVAARNSSIIVAGRTETRIGGATATNDYHVIQFNPTSGGILNQRAFADSRNNIFANDAVYDSINEKLTILGNERTSSGTEGQLTIMQFNVPDDRNATITSTRTIKTNGSTQNAGSGSQAGNITLLPNNQGYIMTATSIKTTGINTDVQLLKFNANLELEWDWLFGTGGTIDQASAVVPLFKPETTDITGYAMTGTFDLGTNTSIGLVKTTNTGALDK